MDLVLLNRPNISNFSTFPSFITTDPLLTMSPSWADGISLGAIVSGFFIHNMFFIKGEWHIQAPLIFRFYIALFLLNLGVYYWIIEQRFEWCLTYTIFTLCFHLIGLFGSMFLYRVWFHPLKRFPGPFLAKVSKLWHVWKVRDSQNYLFLESLRQQYGDFVRTGKNSRRNGDLMTWV